MLIVSNSGQIYTQKEFEDFIVSLGFNIDDVTAVFSDREKLFNEVQDLREICDDWEQQCDGYTTNIHSAVNELEVISNALSSGKGLTKAKAAEKINKCINYYLNF